MCLLSTDRPFEIESTMIEELAVAATNADLLRVLFGEDAAKIHAECGRLWDLFDRRDEVDLRLDTAARLAAFRELERRLAAEPRRTAVTIPTPEAAAPLFTHLATLDHEELHAAYLDVKHRVLAVRRIAIGDTCQVEITPQQLFRPALSLRATAVVIAHNHPSGEVGPSRADQLVTERAKAAGHALGVELLDHLIIGSASRIFSFSAQRELRLS